MASIGPWRLWHFLQWCEGQGKGKGTVGSELQHRPSGFCSSDRQRAVLGSWSCRQLPHDCGEGGRGGGEADGESLPHTRVQGDHLLPPLQKQVPIKKMGQKKKKEKKCCCQFQTPKPWEQTLEEGGLHAHGSKMLKSCTAGSHCPALPFLRLFPNREHKAYNLQKQVEKQKSGSPSSSLPSSSLSMMKESFSL